MVLYIPGGAGFLPSTVFVPEQMETPTAGADYPPWNYPWKMDGTGKRSFCFLFGAPQRHIFRGELLVYKHPGPWSLVPHKASILHEKTNSTNEGYLDDSFHRKGMHIWMVWPIWKGNTFFQGTSFSGITSNFQGLDFFSKRYSLDPVPTWMVWLRPQGTHVQWSRRLLETHTGSPANIPNFRWDLLLVPSLEYHF